MSRPARLVKTKTSASDGGTWIEHVTNAYGGEPRRFYHTMAHVERLLMLFERWDKQAAWHDREAVELAIYFHDIVYDPERHDNEECSIVVFDSYARDAQLDCSTAQKVRVMIRSTIKHELIPEALALAPEDLHDVKMFLDCDLEVLSWEPSLYSVYCTQIRKEYSHFSDVDYRRGRAAVLARFLDRPRLYFSDEFAPLEAQARLNLASEISSLAL